MANRPKHIDKTLMPYAEIAKELGFSKFYVQKVYNKAMSKLRARFGSPEGREFLRDLLAERPGASGHIGRNDHKFPDLHNWTISPVYVTTDAVGYTSRLLDKMEKDIKKKKHE